MIPIDYTAVSAKYTGTPEQKKNIESAIDKLIWVEVPKTTVRMSFSEGHAIKAIIDGFRLAAITHYALSNDLAPLALIAVRNNYVDGPANLYFLDEGHQLCPIGGQRLTLKAA